jgi:hypothetical protein
MKKYLLLLLATACGSKKEDPAATPAAPVLHQIKVAYTASGWDARSVRLDIARNYPGGERAIYAPVIDTWLMQPGGTRTITLSYRDTTARLVFVCHASTGNGTQQYAPAGALLTGEVSVDGRNQGQLSLRGTGGPVSTLTDFLVDTKALK